MKPNELPSVTAFPGEPIAADPVEVLAYALWNDGQKDEAIAVLERQIALEKKLAGGGALPKPPQRAEMTLFPLPAIITAPVREPPAEAVANQNDARSERAPATPAQAMLPAVKVADVPPQPVTATPSRYRPRRRMALVSGLLLLLLGGAGLWASSYRNGPEIAQPIEQAPAPASEAALVTPADSDQAESRNALPAEPAAGIPDAVPADLPSEAEEPVAEDLPFEAEEPVAEDLPPPDIAPSDAAPTNPPEPRIPRSRAEPPQAVAQSPPAPSAPAPAPAQAPAEPPLQSRPATTEAPQQPPANARSERSRRLAERREAAERYVARRRAEAERSAAARQRGEARRPVPDGPSILLGGRGLPN